MIPIFIGGTGRSGTSILKRVVARHAAVAAFRTEIRLIVDPDGLLDLYHALTDRWTPYDADIAVHRLEDFLGRLESTNRFKKALAVLLPRLGIPPSPYLKFTIGDYIGRTTYRRRYHQFLEELVGVSTRGAWAGTPARPWPARIHDTGPYEALELAERIISFVADLFMGAPGGRTATHFVEDTPYNLLHLPDLLRIFPELRMIHVYRDFRDVAASYLVQPWGRGRVETVAGRLSRILERWRLIRDTVPAAHVLEIGLERIVEDPREFQARLLDFTGLPEDAALEAGLVQLDAGRLHQGRWRKEIAPRDVDALERILAGPLAEYGYL